LKFRVIYIGAWPVITAVSVVVQEVEFAFDKYFMSLMLKSTVKYEENGAPKTNSVSEYEAGSTTSRY